MELSFDIIPTRRNALPIRAPLRVTAGGANLGWLKSMPADFEYDPPDMVTSIGSDDASREWVLLDNAAIRQEGELQTTFHRFAVLPGAVQLCRVALRQANRDGAPVGCARARRASIRAYLC